MKTKHIFLLLFLSLYTFNCSESDNPNVCFVHSVTVSDDCNCVNYNCENYLIIEKIEYDRLLNIQNKSIDNCIYINGVGRPGQYMDKITFEGYLLTISAVRCNYNFIL